MTKIYQMHNIPYMLGMGKYFGQYIINVIIYPEFIVVISYI